MGHFKTFLFGFFAAYGLYYITKKDEQGHSILDDLLSDPRAFMHKAKDYAVQDTVKVIKEAIE